MRDYEKFRRQRSFRDAEMNQLKSSFAKVLGLMKNGEPDLDFDIYNQRLTSEDLYRQWVGEMNKYNKLKGRWVDERTEAQTVTQYFYKSEAEKEEEKKKREEEKKAEIAKHEDEMAP